MATVSAVAFTALAIALVSGLFHRNPYAGLVVFVARHIHLHAES